MVPTNGRSFFPWLVIVEVIRGFVFYRRVMARKMSLAGGNPSQVKRLVCYLTDVFSLSSSYFPSETFIYIFLLDNNMTRN